MVLSLRPIAHWPVGGACIATATRGVSRRGSSLCAADHGSKVHVGAGELKLGCGATAAVRGSGTQCRQQRQRLQVNGARGLQVLREMLCLQAEAEVKELKLVMVSGARALLLGRHCIAEVLDVQVLMHDAPPMEVAHALQQDLEGCSSVALTVLWVTQCLLEQRRANEAVKDEKDMLLVFVNVQEAAQVRMIHVVHVRQLLLEELWVGDVPPVDHLHGTQPVVPLRLCLEEAIDAGSAQRRAQTVHNAHVDPLTPIHRVLLADALLRHDVRHHKARRHGAARRRPRQSPHRGLARDRQPPGGRLRLALAGRGRLALGRRYLRAAVGAPWTPEGAAWKLHRRRVLLSLRVLHAVAEPLVVSLPLLKVLLALHQLLCKVSLAPLLRQDGAKKLLKVVLRRLVAIVRCRGVLDCGRLATDVQGQCARCQWGLRIRRAAAPVAH
mmetsp:Transcript_24916/g.78525  ORF Transcript_24916/g.78525 Transcript_24916/m.78525 type:complete len:440 (-) Transcript_24916:456-1775(-)